MNDPSTLPYRETTRSSFMMVLAAGLFVIAVGSTISSSFVDAGVIAVIALIVAWFSSATYEPSGSSGRGNLGTRDHRPSRSQRVAPNSFVATSDRPDHAHREILEGASFDVLRTPGAGRSTSRNRANAGDARIAVVAASRSSRVTLGPVCAGRRSADVALRRSPRQTHLRTGLLPQMSAVLSSPGAPVERTPPRS